MGLDDPVVLAMIVAVAIFLFGSNKIPAIAKALGQARREFDNGMRGITTSLEQPRQPSPAVSSPQDTAQQAQPASSDPSDALFIAARKEGIDTTGKTRQQVASELAWKLRSTNPT
jgi:sec-independent protein translocase protein TatA